MASAVLDARVLYRAPLRDFFLRLAVKLYQPLWTQEIHEEWIRNVVTNRPDLKRQQLLRTRELMDRNCGACLVTGHERLIPELTLPDPDDRHILAATISAGAAVVVTFKLKHFPSGVLAIHGVRALHPDHFALTLYRGDPEQFIKLVKIHRQALTNPPKIATDYVTGLAKCGLRQTTLLLQSHIAQI